MEETWNEYLTLINDMASSPGTYGLDTLRSKLHEELSNWYKKWIEDFDQERFNRICHNLDRVIDFNPPVARHDSIKYYARKLELSMSGGYMNKYVSGQVNGNDLFNSDGK